MRRTVLVALALTLIAAMEAGSFAQEKSAATPSLYIRLGGYDAIAEVTDDFIGRLGSDAQLARFFVGSVRTLNSGCASTS